MHQSLLLFIALLIILTISVYFGKQTLHTETFTEGGTFDISVPSATDQQINITSSSSPMITNAPTPAATQPTPVATDPQPTPAKTASQDAEAWIAQNLETPKRRLTQSS